MPDYTYGRVTIALPDPLAISDEAGTLTDAEARRLANPRRGVGLICQQVADIMEQNPDFQVPGVSSETIRTAGMQAEEIDTLIVELEHVLRVFRQQNLLYDNTAYEQVRRVNDQVRSQAKFQPELHTKFAPLRTYFR